MAAFESFLQDVVSLCNYCCNSTSYKREGSLFFVESFPPNLEFQNYKPYIKIRQSLMQMVSEALVSIDIMSQHAEVSQLDKIDQQFYDELNKAATRGVTIRYITGRSAQDSDDDQLKVFQTLGNKFKVAYLDAESFRPAPFAIQSSNILIVDSRSFYLGSAKCDWQSKNENVDLGLIGINTGMPASELLKKFNFFWGIAYNNKKFDDKNWSKLETPFNIKTPILVGINLISLCFTISPPVLKNYNHTSCLDAILKIISQQTGGILRIMVSQISNYSHSNPHKFTFWGMIDYQIRKAMMENKARVQILVDKTELNNPEVYETLQGLKNYKEMEVRVISLPLDNGTKYVFNPKAVIGSRVAWIGTNDLTPDHLLASSGVGSLIIGDCLPSETLIIGLNDYFNRYFNSKYAEPLK